MKPTFGWIYHTIARDGANLDSLYQDNHRFVEMMRGAFDTLWFDDHLQKNSAPLLESWTALAFLAARYPDFKFGSLVLSQSYRNPALLAKMMSTLQFLTGGRYIAGIGAGWKEDEYRAYGYPYPANKVRAEQLEEAIQILRAMWSSSPATFHGKYYSIQEADCEPLPQPPPPLLIGGAGEKVTLRLVAQYADWMNITFADPDTYAHKLEVLRQHCDQVSRDYHAITKSLWAYVSLTREGRPPKPDHSNRYQIYGTPTQVLDELTQFATLGVKHFMLRFIDFPETTGLELFLNEVLPRL